MADPDLRKRNLTIGAALVCLAALIVFLNTRSRPEPEAPEPPTVEEAEPGEAPDVPPPALPSLSVPVAPDEEAIESTSATADFQASSLTVPTLPVRIHAHRDMMNIIPEDTFFAIHTPALGAARDGLMAFLTACLASDHAREAERDLWRQFAEAQERGMGAEGPVVFFFGGVPDEPLRMARRARILEIEDLALFQGHWDARSPQESVMGNPSWFGEGRYGGAASAVGRCGLEVDGRDAQDWLIEILRPQPRARVADAFDDVAEGTIALGIDTAILARHLRPLLEEAAGDWRTQLTEGRLNLTGEQLILSQMLVTHRHRLLGLLDSAAPVEIRFTPTAEAVDVRIRAALAGSDQHHGGGARGGPLTLAQRLPDGAMLAIDTARPGTEGQAILNLFHDTLIELLAGDDGDLHTALSEVGSEMVFDHSRGREFALAIYRSSSGDVWPRRVVMVQFPSDRAVHDALRGLDSLPDVWPRIPDDRLSARVEDRVEIGGQQVAHIVFGGSALEEIRDLSDPEVLLASPALALLGPPGELHHWAGQMGRTLIFTTEPRPDLMGEILAGEAEGLALPEVVAPVLAGVDFAFHVRWSQVFGWNRDLAEGVGDPHGRVRQHQGLSDTLSEYERSLWIGVNAWSGGFEIHSIWAPVDLHRILSEGGFLG